MQVEGRKQDGFWIVTITGRLDSASSPEFEKACAGWVAEGEKVFVMDFGGLEYISSAGLRSILVTAKKLKAAGGSLAFCAMSPMVSQVFSVSGFAAMFTVYDSLDKALGG